MRQAIDPAPQRGGAQRFALKIFPISRLDPYGAGSHLRDEEETWMRSLIAIALVALALTGCSQGGVNAADTALGGLSAFARGYANTPNTMMLRQPITCFNDGSGTITCN